MPGLVPGIHVFAATNSGVDGRDKPGHDAIGGVSADGDAPAPYRSANHIDLSWSGQESVTESGSTPSKNGVVGMHESGSPVLEANAAPAPQVEARRRWLAILAKAELGELESAWDVLAEKPAFRVLRRGETGLVMVRGRIGGTGQPFNLGEMTIARAAVQLIDDTGRATHIGFGHVAGHAPRMAELVALFDALLQDPARHAAIHEALLAPLANKQAAAKLVRAAKCATSKVDFFTMVRGE